MAAYVLILLLVTHTDHTYQSTALSTLSQPFASRQACEVAGAEASRALGRGSEVRLSYVCVATGP